MLPRKICKITCRNGYFGAFRKIFMQILLTFFGPNSECFAKYDAFFSHIFDQAYLGRNAYRYRRGSK